MNEPRRRRPTFGERLAKTFHFGSSTSSPKEPKEREAKSGKPRTKLQKAPPPDLPLKLRNGSNATFENVPLRPPQYNLSQYSGSQSQISRQYTANSEYSNAYSYSIGRGDGYARSEYGGRRGGPGSVRDYPMPVPGPSWVSGQGPERVPSQLLDTQLGERKDTTELLHALVFTDETVEEIRAAEARRQKMIQGDALVARVPPPIHRRIAAYLDPSDRASLALSKKMFYDILGAEVFTNLNLPENHDEKIRFLIHHDVALPSHLLCFLCAKYHRRTRIGDEVLKARDVYNPLVNCPLETVLPAPKARITPKRHLPFTFAQLVTRYARFGPQYGISVEDLSRRWKEDHWSHNSRFAITKGHLMMRVTSTTFASGGLTQSEMRLLLFSREDYTPYFSACVHYRNGLLMNLCKCALSHIPARREIGGLHGVKVKLGDKINQRHYDSEALVSLCHRCQPMRRCPECPSEYLIELKRVEDRQTREFRRAIVVTRWCDLGSGISPRDPEWAAITGEQREGEVYDSFKAVGRRAVSGVFESHFTEDHMPGQRLLSLNPKGVKQDIDDEDWY
jgi:hypothetical protein